MDGLIPYLEPDSPTHYLDAEELAVGANTVLRERVQIAGALAAAIAAIKDAAPAEDDYGLVVRNIPKAPGEIADGRKIVAASGTAVALLAAATPCKRIFVTAELDNTDYVVLGASTVVAALATRRGTPLAPGNTMEIEIDDVNKIYIDALVNGDGVTFTYIN